MTALPDRLIWPCCTGFRRQRYLLGVQWVEGNDVDHTRGGVEPEQRAVGTSHDLDLLNVFELDANPGPVGYAIMIEINLLAVDQYKQAGIIGLYSAADAHVRLAGCPARDVDPGIHSNKADQVADRRASNIVAGDNHQRRGRF